MQGNWAVIVWVTGACLLSSGFHLSLSGFPKLPGLRMDPCTSPPSRQEGSIPRRGHSDASPEGTEEKKLPNAPHPLLKEREVTKWDWVGVFSVICCKDSRGKIYTFTSVSERENTGAESLQGFWFPPQILNHWGEKKGRRRKRGTLLREEEHALKDTWLHSLCKQNLTGGLKLFLNLTV